MVLHDVLLGWCFLLMLVQAPGAELPDANPYDAYR
jgi:hypothetical protein